MIEFCLGRGGYLFINRMPFEITAAKNIVKMYKLTKGTNYLLHFPLLDC